jgi:hypothetical protein
MKIADDGRREVHTSCANTVEGNVVRMRNIKYDSSSLGSDEVLRKDENTILF